MGVFEMTLKIRLAAIFFSVLCVFIWDQALAGPFYPKDMSGKKHGWFYNKPNVSLKQYDADLKYCHGLA